MALVPTDELVPDDGAQLDLDGMTERELLLLVLARLDVLQSDVDGFKALGEQLADIGSRGLPGLVSGLFRSSAGTDG